VRSSLARLVGSKGYHAQVFADGPFPVEESVMPSNTRTSKV
jgi:hypothetical protein